MGSDSYPSKDTLRSAVDTLGPIGSQCNGDGTCLPARLHSQDMTCSECGACCWDHGTDTPNEAFCLMCGYKYNGG